MVSWSTTLWSRVQQTNKGNASRSNYMRSPTLARLDATTIPYCKVTDWERMQKSMQHQYNSLMFNLAEVSSMVPLVGVINTLLPWFVYLTIYFYILKPNMNRQSVSRTRALKITYYQNHKNLINLIIRYISWPQTYCHLGVRGRNIIPILLPTECRYTKNFIKFAQAV